MLAAFQSHRSNSVDLYMTGLILRVAFLLTMIATFIGIGAIDARRERRRGAASGASSSPNSWAGAGDTSRAQPDPPAAIRRAA
jgi:hypothetical protein